MKKVNKSNKISRVKGLFYLVKIENEITKKFKKGLAIIHCFPYNNTCAYLQGLLCSKTGPLFKRGDGNEARGCDTLG